MLDYNIFLQNYSLSVFGFTFLSHYFQETHFPPTKSIKISINGEDISRESIIYLQCKMRSISLSSRVRVMQLKSLLSWQFHAH